MNRLNPYLVSMKCSQCCISVSYEPTTLYSREMMSNRLSSIGTKMWSPISVASVLPTVQFLSLTMKVTPIMMLPFQTKLTFTGHSSLVNLSNKKYLKQVFTVSHLLKTLKCLKLLALLETCLARRSLKLVKLISLAKQLNELMHPISVPHVLVGITVQNNSQLFVTNTNRPQRFSVPYSKVLKMRTVMLLTDTLKMAMKSESFRRTSSGMINISLQTMLEMVLMRKSFDLLQLIRISMELQPTTVKW